MGEREIKAIKVRERTREVMIERKRSNNTDRRERVKGRSNKREVSKVREKYAYIEVIRER